MSDLKKFIQENPLDVIERFGGIRPMANKLGVAVTTVQGWKKRESIPDTRINDIIQSADQNDIVLTASNENEETRPNIEDTIAQIKARIEQPGGDQDGPDEELMEFPDEETKPDEKQETAETPPATSSATEENDTSKTEPSKKTPVPPGNEEQPASKEAHRAVAGGNRTGSTVIMILIVLILSLLVALFWPVKEDVEKNAQELAAVKQELKELKQEQNSVFTAMGDYMPEDVKSQLETFRQKTGELGQQVGDLAQQTQKMATNMMGAESAAELRKRLNQLEEQFSGLMSSSQIQSVLSRFSTLNDTEEGQEQLDRATGQLHGIIGSLEGRMDLLGDALIVARENSTALGETFEGVPDEDLKAGALLLGLTQFRSALNRDNKPFQEDLALLYSMVGEEDTELKQSLDRLAPQAENGVLTANGLADEFRGLAGDIAVSSLKGEDKTVTDQAKARLSKVLQIKKDGKNLLENESQEKVQKVQSQLDTGDLRGAMQTLSTFEGEAAETAQPFMDKLATSITAYEVKNAINNMLQKASNEIKGIKPLNLKNVRPSSMTDQVTPKNDVVKDESSQFTILPQKQNKLKNNFKELNVQIEE